MRDKVTFIDLDEDGFQARVKMKPGADDCMVFLFHGALNRSKRLTPHYPSFVPALPGTWQVSVPDPTMETFPDLPAGWYLGSSEMPLLDSFPQKLQQLAKRSGCTRRVYVGMSSGGFAALLYSSLDPGSTAVVGNPQTDLRNPVYRRPSRRYFEAAWPGGVGHLPLTLSDCFRNLEQNRIVLVQSSGDLLHLHTQALPFLATLPPEMAAQVAIHIDYFGKAGHAESLSSHAFQNWIRAACKLKGAEAAVEIMQIWYTLKGRSLSDEKPRVLAESASEAIRRDIEIADAIAKFEISEGRRP